MISNTNQRIERKPAAIRSIVKTINFKLGVNKNHLLTQPFRFDKISYVALYLFECPGRMLNLITQSFRTGIKEIPEKNRAFMPLEEVVTP